MSHRESERVIVDAYSSGDVAMATDRLSWNQGIGSILCEGTMLSQLSRKSWAAIHAWAGHQPLP